MAETHTAAVLEAFGEPLVLKTQPIPTAHRGSSVIRVLAVGLSPNTQSNLAGTFVPPALQLHPPFTPGFSAIGRIHTLGPDATTLQPGQLVFHDFWTQSRNDPAVSLNAGFIGGNAALEQT